MVQSFIPKIENVMFLAKAKENPTSFNVNIDGDPFGLTGDAFPEMQLLQGHKSGIVLDKAFQLSVSAIDKEKLEELLMVVKYSFETV